MKTLNEVYAITEKCGIRVDCYDLPDVESMSYMSKKGKCYISIDPMQLDSEQDEKIKLTHELGHCVTGAFYNPYSPLDIRSRHEVRADRWAISQLIPKEELLDAVDIGYTEPWELAEYFDVPEKIMRKAIEYYQNVG